MSIFEPEETVGLFWHRLIGSSRSCPAFPQAAVGLEEMRARVGLIFRACGGGGGVVVGESAPRVSGHRLNLRQAVGLGVETLETPTLSAGALRLPACIDFFPDRADNAGLYEWLAAWFAHAVSPAPQADPLRADLARLRAALATTRAALAAWPGLGRLHARLCGAVLSTRPRRRAPPVEAALEAAILALLRGEREAPGPFLPLILGEGALEEAVAPRGYRTYLPVPLWGEAPPDAGGGEREAADEAGGDGEAAEGPARRATRKSAERSKRGDPLILHRFETIFTIADMIDVGRKVEDDDAHAAKQALKDTPELTLAANPKRAATRLKVDLDLAASAAPSAPLVGTFVYPEWDYRTRRLLPAHCRVLAGLAQEEGEAWAPDEAALRNIRKVRRQFEALQPRRQKLRGEPDGDDLDLASLVRDVADRRAGAPGSERLFDALRPAARDLSLAALMDVSLSTDSFLGGARVLDVEKSALLALTHGLSACGDEHAVFTFSSRRRAHVRVSTVKEFDERLDGAVARRIAALKPGQYTRMGAAVRHVAARLAKRPQRRKLLLLITDGKPNDVDHYEGRYGIEDTRMAIVEARKSGLCVFGVTVDEGAKDYFPHIFGRGAYWIVGDAARLPSALPAIYRQIST
ncbi:nitric oxide reductase activation protein NorD [Methylocella sp.]|uniref:nitric oxide reductase activation protein NorD n=1 Tax=Methylocella sp. TaxID=1978226 RepID=UPI0037850FDB